VAASSCVAFDATVLSSAVLVGYSVPTSNLDTKDDTSLRLSAIVPPSASSKHDFEARKESDFQV